MTNLQLHLDGKIDSYTSEHRIRCKNGSYKWLRDKGLVITRDKSGNPTRVVGIHSDITTRNDCL